MADEDVNCPHCGDPYDEDFPTYHDRCSQIGRDN